MSLDAGPNVPVGGPPGLARNTPRQAGPSPRGPQMECPECNALVREGSHFCMSCGTLVGRLQVVAASVMPERWTAAHTPHPDKKPELADQYLGSASRFPRFIAWVLDGLILGVPLALLTVVFGLEVLTIEEPTWFG